MDSIATVDGAIYVNALQSLLMLCLSVWQSAQAGR